MPPKVDKPVHGGQKGKIAKLEGKVSPDEHMQMIAAHGHLFLIHRPFT